MIYYGDDGNTYNLNKCVGHSGNRYIYEIDNSGKYFAKIFLDKLTTRDYFLIELARLNKNGEINKYVVNIPLVILYSDKEYSKLCGYIIKSVDCSTLLIDIFSGKQSLSIKKRAIVGLNLCKALSSIHKSSSNSMIVGNFSCNNIAVNRNNGEVCLINGIFHSSLRCNGRIIKIPCTELHPDYFMHEIVKLLNVYKGSTLEQLSQNGFTTFTLYTDYYCLAYNLHLLLLNCTPYSCALPITIVGKTSQPFPSTKMLTMNGYYCYSNLYNKTVLPEYCPDFNILTPKLQELFIRAFEAGARQPELRPSPDEFIPALSEYIESLDFCECDGWNHYIRSEYSCSHCEWCRVERAAGSFTDFPKQLEDIKYMTDMELDVFSRKSKVKNNSDVMKHVTQEYCRRFPNPHLHRLYGNGSNNVDTIKKFIADIAERKKHKDLK